MTDNSLIRLVMLMKEHEDLRVLINEYCDEHDTRESMLRLRDIVLTWEMIHG